MIVAWKRVSPLELAAQWQGMNLSLKWNQEATPPRWRLTIDGAVIKQSWPDVRTAQIEIDHVILKLILQAPTTERAGNMVSMKKRSVHGADVVTDLQEVVSA